jgi:hypothetical protein
MIFVEMSIGTSPSNRALTAYKDFFDWDVG